MTAEIVELFPLKESREYAIVVFEMNTRTILPSSVLDNWAMLWLDYAEEFGYENTQKLWIAFNMAHPYPRPQSLFKLVLVLSWMTACVLLGALLSI